MPYEFISEVELEEALSGAIDLANTICAEHLHQQDLFTVQAVGMTIMASAVAQGDTDMKHYVIGTLEKLIAKWRGEMGPVH
jgi:cob(I)alamin adenosyltransferase